MELTFTQILSRQAITPHQGGVFLHLNLPVLVGKSAELGTTRACVLELHSATSRRVEYTVAGVVELESIAHVAVYIVFALEYNEAPRVLVAASNPGCLVHGRPITAVVGTLG